MNLEVNVVKSFQTAMDVHAYRLHGRLQPVGQQHNSWQMLSVG